MEKYELATLPGEAFGDNAENLSLRLATSYLDMEDDAKAKEILRAYQKIQYQLILLKTSS
ncbi:MAG: hypothetical protein Ct9H300mP9_6770 [Candidatus Neomarinimicrobiota bacterium]|nr:MAG: hypothetical protein Ct9H300mP9_6770 [Candidatus Neomarinimicrobiota bacterium]